MRQIFTSPRLENVETVEQLLKQAGIDTRLTNARSWNRATKRDFSYSDRSGAYQWPAVWVLKAEDYTRARQLLRDNGVEVATTRSIDAPSYVAAPALEPIPRRNSIATRLRYVLLVGVLVSAAIYALRATGVL